jgi:tetratricopeptide (TPR) repeat protein
MNNHIQLKETLKFLLKAEKTNHGNPNHSYQIACTYDRVGKERKAIPFYQKAIQQGLIGDELKSAYLGMGSSYRAIGRYAPANQTFRKGIKRFPEDNAMKVFYAMNLFNLKKYQQAMEILLNLIVLTSHDKQIQNYQTGIEFYSNKLTKKF